jgi:hypothetical protein
MVQQPDVPLTAPGPDDNISSRLLGTTGTLIWLAFIVYGLRIATRIRPTFRLGWDDVVMTAAMVCALLAWIFTAVAVQYGLGRHNFYVPLDRRITARKMLFLSQPPTICTASLVKISVALMLRRLKHQKAWRWFLNTAIAVHIVLIISSVTLCFMQCRPLSYMWDPSTKTTKKVICLPKNATDGYWYFICGIITLTDIMFSLVPIAFMYNMRIPTRERIVLCSLMVLGLLASSVVVVRTTTFRRYKRAGDKLWYMNDISIWNLLEGELAILAACIPYLKSSSENLLRRLGLLKEDKALHGATSVRISGYDYDMEMAATRQRMERKKVGEDESSVSATETVPQSDTHSQDFISSGPFSWQTSEKSETSSGTNSKRTVSGSTSQGNIEKA